MLEKKEKPNNQSLIFLGLVLVAFAIILYPGSDFLFDGVIRTEDGTPVEVIDVAIQDQTTELIDLYLVRHLANITLLQNYPIGVNRINISSTVTPQVMNMVCLKEGRHFYQAEITAVSSLGDNNYQLTLDSPLDYAFTTNGGCSLNDKNMNVLGSIDNPVVFSVSPRGLNVSWDINWILFHIHDNSPMDGSTFGGIPKLTNGVVLRSVDGITKNIGNYKYNSDFWHINGEVIYDDKAPAGEYGLASIKRFNGQAYNGVVVRLDNTTGATIEVLIQNDLRALGAFHITVHGQVVMP